MRTAGRRTFDSTGWGAGGVDTGVAGTDPTWKYVGGVRECFDPLNATFFHSELLLDNSASFTSSRMKDLCQNGM